MAFRAKSQRKLAHGLHKQSGFIDADVDHDCDYYDCCDFMPDEFGDDEQDRKRRRKRNAENSGS